MDLAVPGLSHHHLHGTHPEAGYRLRGKRRGGVLPWNVLAHMEEALVCIIHYNLQCSGSGKIQFLDSYFNEFCVDSNSFEI